ncbi:hypothetical protein H4R35_000700 [Dimargaris xerosporica]|nr:hypothetical protein H4R35_000700 [Dimargaris xerosporica]
MTQKFLKYLRFGKESLPKEQDKFDLQYPDLFQKRSLREWTIPDAVQPWISKEAIRKFQQGGNQPSLSKLGLESGIDHLFAVVEALFEVLKDKTLLRNFQIIAPNDQALQALDPAQPQDIRAFMDWCWLKVIGGNNIDLLRYYLGNILVFQIIPDIIRQMLDVNRYTEALELVQRISDIPGFIWVVKESLVNAPNYFEYIIIRAACQEPIVDKKILHDAQHAGQVEVDRLYKCFGGHEPDSPYNALETIFSLQRPDNPEAGQSENQMLCQPLTAKYLRFVLF